MAKPCKYCGTDLKKDESLICFECERWQQRWFHHPIVSFVGAVLTALVLPVAAFLLGREFQIADEEKTTSRTQLERTSTQLDQIVELITAWQPLDQALKSNCSLEHAPAGKEGQECLAEYTGRLAQIDAYVAKVSWTVGTTLVEAKTYETMKDWKSLWWNVVRPKVKQVFLELAKSGATPGLLACQSDFETSTCSEPINAAMAAFREQTLALHCSVAHDVNQTRLYLLKRKTHGVDPLLQQRIHDAEVSGSCANVPLPEAKAVSKAAGPK